MKDEDIMKKTIKTGCFLGILALSFGLASAASRNYKVVNGPDRFYYGHVSLVDSAEGAGPPVVIRGDGLREEAVVNLPLGPGDTVVTPADARCEVQFDSGTIVRLDHGSSLKIETVMARSLSSFNDISNLFLARGRLFIMYKEYDRAEILQVLLPQAAVRLKHNTVALIGAEPSGLAEVGVEYGRADVMFGPDEASTVKKTLKKGERLDFSAEGRVTAGLLDLSGPFAAWNREMNRDFENIHEGISALPKPVQKLPPSVFYFAQKYGNLNGEWVWNDLYGYVWRPYIDRNIYPWGWQPYFYGHWNYFNGQLFWVPDEPWGWVPYHLGIWQWDKKLGWVWIPGSLFAPAWVDWEFFFGYAGWRPWSMFDWYYGGYGFSYLDDGWYYDWPYQDYPLVPGQPGKVTQPRNIVRKDELKRPSSTTFPVPQELRASLKRVGSALARGDAHLSESAGKVPSSLLLVRKEELNASDLRNRALKFDDVRATAPPPEPNAARQVPKSPVNAGLEAARIYRLSEVMPIRERLRPVVVPGPVPASPPAAAPGPRTVRPPVAGQPSRQALGEGGRVSRRAHLDWNPDIRIAGKLGAHIVYSSRSNEIRCPELKLSSADRSAGRIIPRLTSSGVSYTSTEGSAWAGSGSGSTAGASGSTASAGAAARDRGSSERSGSSSSGGERVKK